MSERSPIRVGLVVEQPLLATGIQFAISSRNDMALVRLNHFPEELQAFQPDVLIIDDISLNFFESEPLENWQKAILEAYPTLLISAKDKEWIWRVHKSGIKGFVTTRIRPEELVEAIYSIWKGARYFSQAVVDVLVEMSFSGANQPEQKLHDKLTEREMEILLLVAAGKSSKEIADTLFLSPHTINTHRKHILKKLGCKSAAELLNYAYSQGLMES
jgi:DNA-binding NarL/FixJ family response regulator